MVRHQRVSWRLLDLLSLILGPLSLAPILLRQLLRLRLPFLLLLLLLLLLLHLLLLVSKTWRAARLLLIAV